MKSLRELGDELVRLRTGRTSANLRSTVQATCKALGDSFTAEKLYRWLNVQVSAQKMSPGTAQTYRNRWRTIDRFGRDAYGYPMRLYGCAQIPLRLDAAPVLDWRDESLWRRILEAQPDDRWRFFASVQRRLGLRHGEALALTPADVATVAGGLRVYVYHSRDDRRADVSPIKMGVKGGRALDVHFETEALYRRAVALMKGTSPYVCPFYAPDLNAVMATSVRPLAPLAFPERVPGVKGGSAWHTLRRTFATELHDRGVDVADIQKYLGHKSVVTTHRYIAKLRGTTVDNGKLRALWARDEKRGLRPIEGGKHDA